MNSVTVPYNELQEIGINALRVTGVSQEDAMITVKKLLCADLRGYEAHGIQRLLMYIPRLKKNLINPRPHITVKTLAPSIRLVAGDSGLGPVVATRGMQEAIIAAKENGVAYAGCRDSNHFGASAPYVLMACNENLVALAGTNAFPSMTPPDGLQNLVGNNPLAIGAPTGQEPFVLDISMSVASRGRIRTFADQKKTLPDGWAVDGNGVPTNDPEEALKGFVLPIALHKGYGLALAIDILSGVLTGAGFVNGVKSLLQQWEEPQHIGHFFITIDPSRFMEMETFKDRMKQLYEILKSALRADENKQIRIPGERSAQMEETRRKNGIPMDINVLKNLKDFAGGTYNYQPHRY